MKYERDSPCPQCPFNVDSAKGWIGGHQDPEEIIELLRCDVPFPCHMEVNASNEDDTNNVNHCYGALFYMRKTCKMPRGKEAAQAVRESECPPDTMLTTHEAFINHHTIYRKIFPLKNNVYRWADDAEGVERAEDE